MIVSVTISDEIVRLAQERNLPVVEFVDSLIDKGLDSVRRGPVLNSALDRIRALHNKVSD